MTAIEIDAVQPVTALVQPATEEVVAEVRAEVDATDPGPLARTEDERTLHRVMRARGRLIDELERVEAALEALKRQLANRINGIDYAYGPLLTDIVRKMIQGQKAKSVKTPFGVAGFRKVPGSLVVTDEAKVPEWAFETVTEKRLRKARLTEHMKNTGEVPDGCDVTAERENFYIK